MSQFDRRRSLDANSYIQRARSILDWSLATSHAFGQPSLPSVSISPLCAGFDPCVTPVHYCLAADSSNSISDQEWDKLRRLMRAVASGFRIGPDAQTESKVALLRFGRDVERVFDFDDNTNKTTVLNAITNAQKLDITKPGGTATPDAILECLKIFREQGQEGMLKVIIVFSDGVTHYANRDDEYDTLRLSAAVNQSILEETVNFAVFFTTKHPKRTEREALLITDGNQERAIYDSSFDAIEHEAVQKLSCCKYTVVLLSICCTCTGLQASWLMLSMYVAHMWRYLTRLSLTRILPSITVRH